MKLTTLKIIGTIIAFILAFPLHFLYDKFPNILTSIIAPVNESIWEHMKIIFGCVMLSGVIQKIYIIKKKLNYKNVCISNFIAAIASMPIFLCLFLPIYNIFGHNIVITLILMFITFLISQIITIIIINLDTNLKLENATIIFVIIVYLIFAYFTYNPIKIDLFKDPMNSSYGIKNN